MFISVTLEILIPNESNNKKVLRQESKPLYRISIRRKQSKTDILGSFYNIKVLSWLGTSGSHL
jgi:hypothetical protein